MSLMDQAAAFLQRASQYLNTLVIALVILLGGFILGRLVDRMLHKFLLRTNYDDWCYKLFGVRRDYARATRSGIVYAIYVVTAYLALQELQLDRIALLFVSALLILIVIVSAILAGVETVPQIVGRWKLRTRGLSVGDKVEITDESGKVVGKIEDIRLLDLSVKRKNGDVLFYPMSMVPRMKIKKRKR